MEREIDEVVKHPYLERLQRFLLLANPAIFPVAKRLQQLLSEPAFYIPIHAIKSELDIWRVLLRAHCGVNVNFDLVNMAFAVSVLLPAGLFGLLVIAFDNDFATLALIVHRDPQSPLELFMLDDLRTHSTLLHAPFVKVLIVDFASNLVLNRWDWFFVPSQSTKIDHRLLINPVLLLLIVSSDISPFKGKSAHQSVHNIFKGI
mmetsp:Transcript_14443/g.21066  ORF Transcript_14443/g.21066 Transcript_14443/m.21066 type:complete len:203 (-) Transcript_14443:174-782(-)